MKQSVENVITTFGGLTKMAKLTEIPLPTISSWKIRGLIPAQHMRHLLNTAKRLKIRLAADDLIITPKKKD